MPVLRGNLRKEDGTKIRRNYTFLLDELDGDFLAKHLYEAEVFDIHDKQEISCQSHNSKQKKAEIFLEKLLFSGPDKAYSVFLETLRQHCPHVAERLEGKPQECTRVNTKELQNAQGETRDNPNIPVTNHDEEIANKIRRQFVQYVIPANILHVFHSYNDKVLTQQDIELVTYVSANKGPSQGAQELLARIIRYKEWFSCLLQALRDPQVKQDHVADAMWNALGMGNENPPDKKDSIHVVKNKLLTALMVLRELKNVLNEDGIHCLGFIYQTYFDYPSYRDDIRDWLADHGLPETCINILRQILTVANLQQEKIWRGINYTLSLCLKYSGDGSKFNKRLVEAGAVQVMNDTLRQQHFIANLNRERERHVVRSSIAVLRHLAIDQTLENITERFKDSKTAEVLISLSHSYDEIIKVNAMMALVKIVDEKEKEKLTDTSDVIATLMLWIPRALEEKKTRKYEGFTASILTSCLAKLASVDTNRKKIIDKGALDVCLKMLRHTEPVDLYLEQVWAARCLTELAHGEKSVRKAIKKFPGLLPALKDLKKSPQENVRQRVDEALTSIQGHS